jgi:hypothetical protein
MKVYKYEIKIEDFFELYLPKDAKLLTIQTQNDKPCVWFLVNPEAEKEKRYFRLAGTGHEIEKEFEHQLEYAGTFQLGSFVGHLFEILTSEKVLVRAMQNNLF